MNLIIEFIDYYQYIKLVSARIEALDLLQEERINYHLIHHGPEILQESVPTEKRTKRYRSLQQENTQCDRLSRKRAIWERQPKTATCRSRSTPYFPQAIY
jgi:hypothetical protein